MNLYAFVAAMALLWFALTHDPINGVNLVALVAFTVVVWYFRPGEEARHGCEDCQGVQPCHVCHPSVERAS